MQADAADDELPPRRSPSWTVVHKPRVAIRKEPRVDAPLLATRVTGDVVEASGVEGGWIRLAGENGGWMLIDGSSVGLGILLEPVPVPDSPITLCFARPDNGKPMLKLTLPFCTTIKDTKAAVEAATGLRSGSMVLARGKMGSRISDSSENIFADDQSLWACGYVDGQVPGVMYLGEAANDMNDAAKAGTLEVVKSQ